MKKINWFTLMVAGATGLFMTGCTTPTTNIDTHNDTAGAVAGIDYRDLRRVTSEMINSLLASGRLTRPNGTPHVMTIGKIKNDTTQRFDTDTLTAQITEELTNSGKVLITSAMAATSDNRDEMITTTRSVRGDAEFNQSTVAGQGQLLAPTLSLFGKIIQKDIAMDNGDKQIEYYFQLRITDLVTGLQWWQKQVFVGKRTDRKTPIW